MRLYKRNKDVTTAWSNNLRYLQEDRDGFFADILRAIHRRKRLSFFRWHVSGEIPDQDYFYRMAHVAVNAPDVHFLVFTKRHELDYTGCPSNLSVVASMWPGWGDANLHLPKFWVQDGFEWRIPPTARWCSGDCVTCRDCWFMRDRGISDIAIRKHPESGVLKGQQLSLLCDLGRRH